MRITVLMPLHNPEPEHLKIAIDSMLNQTFNDFEFLIINDGSVNDIDDIIFSYNDARIRYIKQENIGLAATLNKGIELATADIIARMDQDDIAHSDRFEKQIKFLNTHEDISIVGSWIKHFPEPKIIKMPQYPDLIDFLDSCVMCHPTVMFRKSDFLKYSLKYNEKLKTSEDYDLWSRAVRVLKFANLQEVLLDYRIHDSNMTVTRKKLQLQLEFKIKQNLMSFITNNKKIQSDIIKSINKNYQVEKTFLEKIFSIKNKYSYCSKYKNLSILGLNFLIEIKNKEKTDA